MSLYNRHYILHKYLLFISLVNNNLHQGRDFHPFSSVFFPQYLEQCLPGTQYYFNKYLLHKYYYYSNIITMKWTYWIDFQLLSWVLNIKGFMFYWHIFMVILYFPPFNSEHRKATFQIWWALVILTCDFVNIPSRSLPKFSW